MLRTVSIIFIKEFHKATILSVLKSLPSYGSFCFCKKWESDQRIVQQLQIPVPCVSEGSSPSSLTTRCTGSPLFLWDKPGFPHTPRQASPLKICPSLCPQRAELVTFVFVLPSTFSSTAVKSRQHRKKGMTAQGKYRGIFPHSAGCYRSGTSRARGSIYWPEWIFNAINFSSPFRIL